ncbi:MAG: hypothetical protein R3E82_22700 [Pseudomonadales bacterium]
MTLINRAAFRAIGAALLIAVTATPALAREDAPRWEDQTLDIVVARPLGVVATGVGAVLWGVSLPFTLLGGNAGEAADSLVLGPARETFIRCLGCRSEGRRQKVATDDAR